MTTAAAQQELRNSTAAAQQQEQQHSRSSGGAGGDGRGEGGVDGGSPASLFLHSCRSSTVVHQKERRGHIINMVDTLSPRLMPSLTLGLLLWNVFENRKRTFSVFKTDRQPYGLENGPFSGEFFRFSFSGRPPLGNGAPFSINIVIETGAWIWSRHGFPHIVRGNKR